VPTTDDNDTYVICAYEYLGHHWTKRDRKLRLQNQVFTQNRCWLL